MKPVLRRMLIVSSGLLLSHLGVSAEVPKGYENVMFSPVGTCDDPAQLRFRKLGMIYTDTIGKAPDGKDILLNTAVALFPAGAFFVHYTEYEVGDASGAGSAILPLFTQDYLGTWTASALQAGQVDLTGEDHKLDFALLLSQMTIGNQILFGLAFMPDFERESARSHQIFTTGILDTTAGFGESAAKYCANPY